jgi:hypothetical protein
MNLGAHPWNLLSADPCPPGSSVLRRSTARGEARLNTHGCHRKLAVLSFDRGSVDILVGRRISAVHHSTATSYSPLLSEISEQVHRLWSGAKPRSSGVMPRSATAHWRHFHHGQDQNSLRRGTVIEDIHPQGSPEPILLMGQTCSLDMPYRSAVVFPAHCSPRSRYPRRHAVDLACIGRRFSSNTLLPWSSLHKKGKRSRKKDKAAQNIGLGMGARGLAGSANGSCEVKHLPI